MRRRRNPISKSTKEMLLVGGGVVALGVVGYVLYNYVKSSQASAGLAAVNAATGQTTLPGGAGVPSSSSGVIYDPNLGGSFPTAPEGSNNYPTPYVPPYMPPPVTGTPYYPGG
jgi:hypothetical protein